ncbi:MAG: chromosome partitioning protein ParB, partial [Anaerolineae bacterium]|nr:chromosome partitioning protein ParB [Anaerolineae bacterium]
DKVNDFDRNFHPLNETTENRWVWVATAMLRGVSLPPVELILMGNTYYVVDGHHRISVAKMLKYHYIDAIVTVWD